MKKNAKHSSKNDFKKIKKKNKIDSSNEIFSEIELKEVDKHNKNKQNKELNKYKKEKKKKFRKKLIFLIILLIIVLGIWFRYFYV